MSTLVACHYIGFPKPNPFRHLACVGLHEYFFSTMTSESVTQTDPENQDLNKDISSPLFHASQKTFYFEHTLSGSCFRCLHASEASSGIYSWQPVPLHQAHHTGLLSQHPKRQLSPRWRYRHSGWAAVGKWVEFALSTNFKTEIWADGCNYSH